MRKLEGKIFPSETKIFSSDFDSLYMYLNIDHYLCLNYLSDYFKDKLTGNMDLSIFVFKRILEIVLKNNFFRYKNDFYKQISGIIMGSKAGPSIANIFLYLMEIKWME